MNDARQIIIKLMKAVDEVDRDLASLQCQQCYRDNDDSCLDECPDRTVGTDSTAYRQAKRYIYSAKGAADDST